ncbi:MAG: NnrS family protein, partial [Limisphaerales bacterium]
MTDTVLPAALRRRREYVGPALFSYGFRPFFLGASVWAALAVLLWLPQYFGEISVPTAFAPLDWHVHEMIFGYVAAAIAGFLLTAIPNWTGRLPVNGYPLAALVALWMAGRIAVATSAIIGAGIA